MEPTIARREAVSYEDLLVRNWRVSRLVSLGIPEPLAEAHAGHIDWHHIARIIQRGCPPLLALRIVC